MVGGQDDPTRLLPELAAKVDFPVEAAAGAVRRRVLSTPGPVAMAVAALSAS